MYYFAYGSNINLNEIKLYLPKQSFIVIGPAYVENYVFKYRKLLNNKKKSGVSNIEKRNNSKTYGILYFINDKYVNLLNKKEGFYNINNFKNKYNKIDVKCVLIDKNIKIDSFSYKINELFKGDEVKPSNIYYKKLENGYYMHCLPKYYLNRIRYIFT